MNQNKQSNPPHEFKVMRVRECVAPSLVDNPQRAYEYWKANIPQSDWYDEAKEAFVVLVLNTRSRIIGHKAIELAQNELNALILFKGGNIAPLLLCSNRAFQP